MCTASAGHLLIADHCHCSTTYSIPTFITHLTPAKPWNTVSGLHFQSVSIEITDSRGISLSFLVCVAIGLVLCLLAGVLCALIKIIGLLQRLLAEIEESRVKKAEVTPFGLEDSTEEQRSSRVVTPTTPTEEQQSSREATTAIIGHQDIASIRTLMEEVGASVVRDIRVDIDRLFQRQSAFLTSLHFFVSHISLAAPTYSYCLFVDTNITQVQGNVYHYLVPPGQSSIIDCSRMLSDDVLSLFRSF